MLEMAQVLQIALGNRLKNLDIPVSLIERIQEGIATVKFICLVDGFNLYHSLRDAIADGGPESIKWLDIQKLAAAKLKRAFPDATLDAVYYFTSDVGVKGSPSHQNQQVYVRALRSHGVTVEFGHFKVRPWICKHCNKENLRTVEKRTDINIAVQLIRTLHEGHDGCVIISGDSDLAGAVKTAKVMFPKKKDNFLVCLPYKRTVSDLIGEAHKLTHLSVEDYRNHRFPKEIKDEKKPIRIPRKWDKY